MPIGENIWKVQLNLISLNEKCSWCGVPGSVNGQESVSFCPGVLRNASDKLKQIFVVVKLAEVDMVFHILAIGHYAHLENI